MNSSRQTPPSAPSTSAAVGEIAGACLGVRARLVSRWVTSIYEEHLQGSNLTLAQVNLLVAAGTLGWCSPSRLGDVLMMERSSVSRSIGPLLDRGLLEAEETDAGRVRRVLLSKAGERALTKILPQWQRAQEQIETELGVAGVGAVHRLADTLWQRVGIRIKD